MAHLVLAAINAYSALKFVIIANAIYLELADGIKEAPHGFARS